MKNHRDRPGVLVRLLRTLVLVFTAFLVFQLISIDLSWQKQAALGVLSILLGLAFNRMSDARAITIGLMFFSMTATFRYGWWRVRTLVEYFSGMSSHHFSYDAVAMLVLLAAELYTTMIMILGYFQTAWPLARRPIPMPADESLWPHVDVLIPTYNEPLSLVRYTALSALNIDYPPEKLHIYILDDGTREDFKEFCAEAGVGYIIRPQHSHAKAGNINHALESIHSPMVAIFDCDHVPTRSFLQMTVGWMLADNKLAMLQTPHHFYSPDPFERNLLQYRTIPNEAELFYGIVQDGNDFWNATFFCGSCALIRRSALDEVGGIAVETVTEDAHTSLRLQRLGYNTAYINIPLAAGLATESLAAHVGQRVRWARGMIQILRTDNPLLGKGLKFTQRLCYFNAMAHFLYALPRLIFLLAPLVYLMTGHSIIPGYWVTITVYALPHLFLSNLTNSRIQGWHRHSFWNEIYEAVLAPYILAPTLLALINPKLGKFNVTDKGSTLAETRFDSRIAIPTRLLLLANFAGLAFVPYRLLVADPEHPGAVAMNLVWVLFNIVILGVAAAVAYEHRQRRGSVRIDVHIVVRLKLAGGRTIDGETSDMSVGGTSVRLLSDDAALPLGSKVEVSFPHVCGEDHVNAEVVGGGGGNSFRLSFITPTILEQEIVGRALYSRADAWIQNPKTKEMDRPLVSLGRVMVLSMQGLYELVRSQLPERSSKKTAAAAGSTTALLLLILAGAGRTWAQPAQVGSAAQPVAAATASTADRVARQKMTFKDLGVDSPIQMHGPHSYYTLHFTLSHSLVPHQAVLRLIYTLDPKLDPRAASLRVIVNGVTVSTFAPNPAQPAGAIVTAEVAIPELLLVRNNTLTFEFTGNLPLESSEQARLHVFSRIASESTLDVSGEPLHLIQDLSGMPLPIFDSDLESETDLPFVFLTAPDTGTLQAAGVVASWLGVEAGTRQPLLNVSVGAIPAGNAVLVSSRRSELPPELQVPAGAGPLLALRPNPTDPFGSLLIVAGDSDAQALAAASTLALTGKVTAANQGHGPSLSGDTAQPAPLALPPARANDDAPRWMKAGVANPIAGCQNPAALETEGSSPVSVYFHVPPGLYYGELQNVNLRLDYRYDARKVAAGSALRTVVNGNLVNEAPLAQGPDFALAQRQIQIPVADLRPFGNTILFNFDFVPLNPNATSDSHLYGAVMCSSMLDLRQTHLWTDMPNLELFSNTGFPFTQRADLAQSVVILPSAPKPAEIALFLQLMTHFGAQTGYPALRVTVSDPGTTIQPGIDYLLLGVIGNQPAFDALQPQLPVAFDREGRISLRPEPQWRVALDWVSRMARVAGDTVFQIPHVELPPPTAGLAPDAVVEEIRSPIALDGSIVVVALKQDSSAADFSAALVERSQSEDMTGPVSLLQGGRFASYQVDEPAYHVGALTWYATMRFYLAQYFLLLLVLVALLSLLLAWYIYQWMAWHAQERVRLRSKN
jgi:cellulose synthase (UDP-forming)